VNEVPKSAAKTGFTSVNLVCAFSPEQNFVKKVFENKLEHPKLSDRREAIREESDVDIKD
jgi:hypothetical protein